MCWSWCSEGCVNFGKPDVTTDAGLFAILVAMQYIPIKTRILHPPQDDLFAVLDECLADVQEKDVLVISSKIVSIHEGNCLPAATTDKSQLIEQEADLLVPRDYWSSPLTVTRNAFIGTAGVDESNANGYLVLLPKDSFASAKTIYEYIKTRFGIEQCGVVVTDSHSTPLRRGAIGVAIGWWGIEPTIDHVGEEDLFGRELKVEVSNLVDGIAAGATVVMGETVECQPVVIARDIPNLSFAETDTKDQLFVSFNEDTFRVLYELFLN